MSIIMFEKAMSLNLTKNDQFDFSLLFPRNFSDHKKSQKHPRKEGESEDFKENHCLFFFPIEIYHIVDKEK